MSDNEHKDVFEQITELTQQAKTLTEEQGDPDELIFAWLTLLGLVHAFTRAACDVYESVFKRPVELIVAEKQISHGAAEMLRDE